MFNILTSDVAEKSLFSDVPTVEFICTVWGSSEVFTKRTGILLLFNNTKLCATGIQFLPEKLKNACALGS